MRRIILAAAVLAMAGCGDGGSNPVSAEGSRPALNGSGLPNLYVHTIQPQRENGVLKVRIRICNNGTASAGTSTTYLQHWNGIYFEAFDLYTTNLNWGWCTWTTSPALIDNPPSMGYTHSYYVWADDYQVVTESNENDNHGRLESVY